MLPPLTTLIDAPVQTRAAVVAVLAWVMGADGELRPEERNTVSDTARRLSVNAPAMAPPWSESWAPLLTPFAPEVLLLAALLATADGDLAPAEEECLAMLAGALGLDIGAVPTLTTWAQEGHRWLHKGQALAQEARSGSYGLK